MEELEVMDEVEKQTSVYAKLKLASKTGYTGLTKLHRLFFLYGFNPFVDLVHDVMHLIPMNGVKKLINRLVENDSVNLKEIQEKIDCFPFTRGIDFVFVFIFCGRAKSIYFLMVTFFIFYFYFSNYRTKRW